MKVKATPNITTMPGFEMARWGALIEAVNIVGEECDDRNIDFETVNLEPLVLRKYVESTCDRICQKIEQERKKEKEISKKRTTTKDS